MIPKVVIITTKDGTRYGSFIAKEINLLGFRWGVTTLDEVREFLSENGCTPQKTIIHTRTASPVRVYNSLKSLEDGGYRVINKAKTVKKTSDKFFVCEYARENNLPSPQVWRYPKENNQDLIKEKVAQLGRIIVKPIISQEEGRYTVLFEKDNLEEIPKIMALMPKRDLFLQEFVDYQRLYRVVVIGFKALPQAVFYDQPKDSWKVSVCLNLDLFWEKNPSGELLDLAEKIARIFEAEVSFIDIFRTKKGWILNEINTACSLIIHERKSRFNISAKIAEYLIGQLRSR